MKKMISKFADSLLTREDLKRVKGGYGGGFAGCNSRHCTDNAGNYIICGNRIGYPGCGCPGGGTSCS